MRNAKQIAQLLSYHDVTPVLLEAQKRGLSIEHIEGSLTDEYVIQTHGARLFKGFKRYKFIVIVESYVNAWQSLNAIYGTDSVKKVARFLESRDVSETQCINL